MPNATSNINTVPAYDVTLNEHPFTLEMLAALNQYGVNGLLLPASTNDLRRQRKKVTNDFSTTYVPTTAINTPYPETEFDFGFGGPYSVYNWEIFFHSVSLIARQLRQNNKFAEAIRWLNYVFDPTDPDDSLGDLRYWQIKPFMQNVAYSSIKNMIRLLSTTPSNPNDVLLKKQYDAQIAAWRANPFDPHLIASMRPRAYMLWTVMEFITTLTDWGDYLFRQDTMESINEATNLYVMASEILGKRPKKVTRPSPTNQNFKSISGNLSSFSNILVAFENEAPAMKVCSICSRDSFVMDCPQEPALSTVTDLLFCIPDNPKLVAMWDRVEDRLFKIRHCMNIEGQVRQLALFSPPIDPALLVQAAAAGLSVGDALANLMAPLPYYKFTFLLQKANEFCGEVKGLGGQILPQLEKRDAEDLSLFRQVHEQNILKAARAVKIMAIDEAKEAYATVESSKNLIQIRLNDYSNRKFISQKEQNTLDLTAKAENLMIAEQAARLIGGILSQIPDFTVGASGAAASPVATFKFGGSNLAALANATSTFLGLQSSVHRNAATLSTTYASYERRMEDWKLQTLTATEELKQVDRQLIGAKIKINVAEKELENHDLQVAQSEEMYDWLKSKYTNSKLYSWMLSQVTGVYRQAFDLAFTLAKMAQRSLNYELGTNADIISYGQWDSTKGGLLAGERLSVQLRELETFYIDNNKRNLEISKNISLALLDPLALENLKATGSCTITIPDALFNMDFPGHYNRRIKTVSVSIPCIAGSQTSISATLCLTGHKVKTSETDYSVIVPDSVPLEKIVTSSAQNDSGVFELNFKDERFLPFEGKGAVSQWTLDLSQIIAGGKIIRQFDFNTIADVVMHMKYSATDAGASGNLGSAMQTNLLNHLNSIVQAFSQDSLHYSVNIRHDMPNEWHEFKSTGETYIDFTKIRLPYFMQLLTVGVTGLTVFAKTSKVATSAKIKVNNSGTATTLTHLANSNRVYKGSFSLSVTDLPTTVRLNQVTSGADLSAAEMDELILVLDLALS